MSADNWTTCPNCKKLEQDKVNKVRQRAEESISFSEYSLLLHEVENLLKEDNKEYVISPSLREDYEIGIYNGKFYVDYEASCNKCGWQHNFKHREEIK